MTEKLFDTDSYITEFECKVVELYTEDKFLCLILDRTAFSPEGGGQTCDKGWLNSVNVENVQNFDLQELM